MPRHSWFPWLVLSATVVAVLVASVARCDAPQKKAPNGDDAIRAALDKPVSLDFHETPLETAAAYLADKCGIPVVLDQKSLADVGTDLKVPITFHVKNITLRSALRLMLRPLQLTCLVGDDVLMITTPEEADNYEVTRVYPVGDILAPGGVRDPLELDFDSLGDLITCCIQPTTWGGSGPSPVYPFSFDGVAALVFPQTEDVHEEVNSLLKAFRAIARQTVKGETPQAIRFEHVWPEPPAYEAVRKALSRPVSLDFDKMPLDQALARLARLTGVNVLADCKALADVGLSEKTPVTVRASDAPLESAMRRMLRDLGLTSVVHDEVLLVTTLEEANTQLAYGVYPVGDLLPAAGDPVADEDNLKAICRVIRTYAYATTWDTAGGPGAVRPVAFNVNALVVSQTEEGHEQVAATLTAIRAVAKQISERRAPEPILWEDGEPEEAARDKAIRGALEKKANFQFVETPLKDAAAYITKTFSIECRLDTKGLDDVGLAGDTPITCNLRGISLRSALAILLRPLDLTHVIRDGTLLITTPEEAINQLTLGVYPVGDLVGDGQKSTECLDQLRGVISECVQRIMWEDVGGPGSMTAARVGDCSALYIAHAQEVHDEVAAFLAGIREAARRAGGEREHEPILLYDGRCEENPPATAIREGLARKVRLDFDEMPLSEAVDFVQKTFGIPCQIDSVALQDVGLGAETPITIHVSGVTLGSALTLALHPLELCWVIRDEVLLITTPEQAASMTTVGVYPVGDLVVCRHENGELWDDYDSLVDVIAESIEPDTWSDLGGPGRGIGGTFGKAKVLVISQTGAVHEQIARLLADLREAAARVPSGGQPPLRDRPLPPTREPFRGDGPEPVRTGGGMF